LHSFSLYAFSPFVPKDSRKTFLHFLDQVRKMPRLFLVLSFPPFFSSSLIQDVRLVFPIPLDSAYLPLAPEAKEFFGLKSFFF